MPYCMTMTVFGEVSMTFQGYIAPITKQLIYIFISRAAGATAICGECFYLSHFYGGKWV